MPNSNYDDDRKYQILGEEYAELNQDFLTDRPLKKKHLINYTVIIHSLNFYKIIDMKP